MIFQQYSAQISLVLVFAALGLIYYAVKRGFLASLIPSFKGKSGGGTPLLDTYCVDFTRQAVAKQLDTVIGRAGEIRKLVQVLSRRSKNNAMLIGPPGVGKTAIVEGLAQRIVAGEVPDAIKGKRVLALDVASLMSGTKYRGEFEERTKKIVNEIEASKRSIILFIDEVHSVVQSQGSEGSINLSDILKPALSRGDLQMIGATTIDEYEKYIKPDTALERRFQPVEVREPSLEETVAILRGIKDMYRQYHLVEFTDAAFDVAVRLSNDLVSDRKLPDKAIDAIDEAAAMVKVSHLQPDAKVRLLDAADIDQSAAQELWRKIQDVDAKIGREGQSNLKAERAEIEGQLRQLGVLVVDSGDIETVIKDWIK